MLTTGYLALIGMAVSALMVAAYMLGRLGEKHEAKTKRVYNVDRKFGSLLYYEVVKLNGKWCFFTDNDLREAHDTAEKNKEDIPY